MIIGAYDICMKRIPTFKVYQVGVRVGENIEDKFMKQISR